MDYSTAIQLIGSLGFPIVMCLMMYYRMDKQDAQHSEEMSKMADALNNNTLAITNLTLKLEQTGVIK